MGRIVDIAALPHKNIGVAVNSSGCVYVLGDNNNLLYNIYYPIIAQVSDMWDVFDWNDIPYTICVSPSLSLNNVGTDEASDVVEDLETAFDDPVCVIFFYNFCIFKLIKYRNTINIKILFTNHIYIFSNICLCEKLYKLLFCSIEKICFFTCGFHS